MCLSDQEGGGRIVSSGCSWPWRRTVGILAQGKAKLVPAARSGHAPAGAAVASWADAYALFVHLL